MHFKGRKCLISLDLGLALVKPIFKDEKRLKVWVRFNGSQMPYDLNWAKPTDITQLWLVLMV